MKSGAKLSNYLILGATGPVKGLSVRVQRRSGKRWKKVKTLPSRKIDAGIAPIKLNFGQLQPGRYRLLVSVSGSGGESASSRVPFSVGS